MHPTPPCLASRLGFLQSDLMNCRSLPRGHTTDDGSHLESTPMKRMNAPCHVLWVPPP